MDTSDHAPRADAAAADRVVHDVGGAGPIYGAAIAPGGWRYFSDQFHHRIIIESPEGRRRFVGRPGADVGEFRFPRGLAVCQSGTACGTRLFVCDAWNHRVQVFDGQGETLGAFGRQGQGPGEFEVPSDVVAVYPECPPGDRGEGRPLVAVADRWNSRVQIFEADGTLVRSLGGRDSRPVQVARAGTDGRAGWPHFRVAPDPVCWFPARLRWRSPWLEITGASGRCVSVDLAAALLPDFETWLDEATSDALVDAAQQFRDREGEMAVPGAWLAAIETRLGAHLVSEGAPVAAGRLWARPWPAGMTLDQVEEHLGERAGAVTEFWLRSGGAPGVGRLAGQVSRALSAARARRSREIAGSMAVDLGAASAAPSPPTERTTRLAHQLRVIRGRTREQGRVVWTAPDGSGGLGAVAAGEEGIGILAATRPVLWAFDRHLVPLGQFQLPDGGAYVGIAAHPMGGWLLVDAGRLRIVHVDRTGRQIWQTGNTDHAGLFTRPSSLAAEHARLVVADAGSDRLVVFDLAGNPLDVVPCPPAPMAVGTDQGRWWVASWSLGGLHALDASSGEVIGRCDHAELGAPSGLDAIRGGTVAVAERWLGRVHAFDDDGRWLGMVETADGLPLGGLGGLAALDDGSLIVSDAQHGWLVHLERPDGGRPWPRHA